MNLKQSTELVHKLVDTFDDKATGIGTLMGYLELLLAKEVTTDAVIENINTEIEKYGNK